MSAEIYVGLHVKSLNFSVANENLNGVTLSQILEYQISCKYFEKFVAITCVLTARHKEQRTETF
jgi:hypothetical protein